MAAVLTRRSILGLAPFAAAAGFSPPPAVKAPWLLGANTAIDGFGLIEAIQTVWDLGFPAIEIHPMGVPDPTEGKFPGFLFDKLEARRRSEIRKALKGFRCVTTHLPYAGLDYMSASQQRRDSSIRTIEVAMEATAFFGAKLAVLHPQPPPDGADQEIGPKYLRRFREWGDRARKLRFRIALETGYPRSIRDYVRLVQEIDHEAVGATVDVGHQKLYAELAARVKPEQRSSAEGIRAYNDTTIEIIQKLGKRVFHLHVHDIDPQTWEEHKPLVHDFVDYPWLFNTLRQIGYEGVLMFEIGGKGSELPGYLRDGKRKLSEILAAPQ